MEAIYLSSLGRVLGDLEVVLAFVVSLFGTSLDVGFVTGWGRQEWYPRSIRLVLLVWPLPRSGTELYSPHSTEQTG